MRHHASFFVRCAIRCASALALFLSSASIPAADISGEGWRLWPDREARWVDDPLFLPGDPELAGLRDIPRNPPTGGWRVLTPSLGIPVVLPSTIEEHYWGALQDAPYRKEYTYEETDPSVRNGAYKGVSWWWRRVVPPPLKKGERLVIRFRAARLRAEVYWNEQLCGYQLIPELPFEADVTQALKPGVPNVLAVRITNPGGRLDWKDSSIMRWGTREIPPSHGFGGLDAGIEMVVRPAVHVSDLFVMSFPEPGHVRLRAEVRSDEPFDGTVALSIAATSVQRAAASTARSAASAPGTAGAKPLWTDRVPVSHPGGGATRTVEVDASVPGARVWDLGTPVLYRATAVVAGMPGSVKGVDFGFRWFTVEGLGEDARLTLNGRRIVLRSAISWGYWAPNGIFPGEALARKEIQAAKALGLNCLQGHRNLVNPVVLDVQDRTGLLRYEEPGGGVFALGDRYAREAPSPTEAIDTSGNGGDAQTFVERWEEEKIVAMVRRDRNHPSVILYCIQNEITPDLRNPRIHRILRRVHETDPSRIVLLKSGIQVDNQAWMTPYENVVRVDDGTGFSGWWDRHTVGGPGTYRDAMYKGPDDWTNRSDNRKEIVMWGESLGAAVPDDHEAIVDAYRKAGRRGYDLADHERTLAAYNTFLDRWGFRTAFPTASTLFRAVGDRSYFFWQKVVENTRMSDPVDYHCISGWESTAIENHSGIVDAHRNFRTDPAPLARVCEPEVLVVRPRNLVAALGETVPVDIHLVSETERSGTHRLTVEAVAADGQVIASDQRDVLVHGGRVFGELLHAGVDVSASQAGYIKVRARLVPSTGAVAAAASGREKSARSPAGNHRGMLEREERIFVVDVAGGPALPTDVRVIEPAPLVAKVLGSTFGITPRPFDAGGTPQAVILSGRNERGEAETCFDPIEGTEDDVDKSGVRWAALPPESFDISELLKLVHGAGTRLVIWPEDPKTAEKLARALDGAGVAIFEGMVGTARASWMGSWYFVRKHRLFDGLPVDTVMDWRYQTIAWRGDGLRITAPGIEVAAGYGRDHDPVLGAGAFVIPYGKGEIVFLTLPQLASSLTTGDGVHVAVARRLLANALR